MPISPFQDEQNKNLSAALASIETEEEVVNSAPLIPNMSANCPPSTMYSGVPQLAAFSMLSPDEFLAAKRQAAAFLSQIPSFFSTHTSTFFPTWGAASPQGINLGNVTPNSPPVSPLSTINNNVLPQAANQQSLRVISPRTTPHPQLMRKKTRKLRVKKDIISPSVEVSMNINDIYNSTGTLSPPSSGSSPNSSAHDVSIPRNNVTRDGTPREKSFTCKICQRCFGYKHVLQNHERTHTGEKPFRCPECNKRFTRDHHLKTHMRLHTGEKPYKCDHCDRQFVQVANLRRHLRVHTGERPYICKICNGKFSDSNQLKSHMLVHNGEKPFKCDKCHMKFKRRHYLLNHKCGMQSPVTPNFSPKSLYISEESMDTSKQLPSHAIINYASISENEEDGPLDLSEDVSNQSGEPRNRRANDIRRVFHLPPPQIPHVDTDMPEQTEPEDLSMHLPRNDQLLSTSSSAAESPEPNMIIVHNDYNFEELDNAASLYMRQQSHLQSPNISNQI